MLKAPHEAVRCDASGPPGVKCRTVVPNVGGTHRNVARKLEVVCVKIKGMHRNRTTSWWHCLYTYKSAKGNSLSGNYAVYMS